MTAHCTVPRGACGGENRRPRRGRRAGGNRPAGRLPGALRARLRFLRVLLLPGCAALLAAGAGGCRSTEPAAGLRGDRLFLAPAADYLAARLALVEQRRLLEARELWARHSLIAQPPPDRDRLEHLWWRELGAAGERLARGRRDGRAYYRLAQALNDARWHREALSACRQALALDPGLAGARQLAALLANLERFTAELDSVAVPLRARAARGAADPRALPRYASALAGAHELSPESLLQHGLYLGQRQPARAGEPWGVELSVIVERRAPVTVSRPEGTVRVRGVLLDDDRLGAAAAAADPWTAAPGRVGGGDEIVVYHHRELHRRAGMILFRALERRGGAPPARVAELTAPLVEPAATARAAPAAPPPGGGLDALCDPRLADALRLAAAAPLLARVQTRESGRDHLRRAFIRALMERRLEQVEQRAARVYIDRLHVPEPLGERRRAERLILDTLLHGPLPRWELAAVVTAACVADPAAPRVLAARAILRYLRKATGIDTADQLLACSPRALREAAARIAADRGEGAWSPPDSS